MVGNLEDMSGRHILITDINSEEIKAKMHRIIATIMLRNILKKILFLSLTLGLVNTSYARNYGHICIDYLSKNGTLDISEQNKYTLNEYVKLLEHLSKINIYEKNGYQFGEIFLNLGKRKYARGIKQGVTEKFDVYEPSMLKGPFSGGPFFQNGIIYFESSGDAEDGELMRYKSILGGKINFECIEMPQYRDMREAEELREFLEENKDLLESNE